MQFFTRKNHGSQQSDINQFYFQEYCFLKGCKIQFYFIFVDNLNEVLSMRIDQYLWCIRLFKSRNMATTACKNGQILINEHKLNMMEPTARKFLEEQMEAYLFEGKEPDIEGYTPPAK